MKKFKEISKKFSHTGSYTLTFSCTIVFREVSISQCVLVHTLVFYALCTRCDSFQSSLLTIWRGKNQTYQDPFLRLTYTPPCRTWTELCPILSALLPKFTHITVILKMWGEKIVAERMDTATLVKMRSDFFAALSADTCGKKSQYVALAWRSGKARLGLVQNHDMQKTLL